MTCIAAVAHEGKVVMGGDSAGTYPNFDILTITHSKLLGLRNGEVQVGCCGSARMLDLLEFHMKLPSLPRKAQDLRRWMVREFIHRMRLVLHEGGLTYVKNGVEEFNGSLLVASRGRIFLVECDFQVAEPDTNFYAIGSGGSIAQGSLYSTARLPDMPPGARVLEALEAAEKWNAAVRRPFTLVTV